MFAESAKVVGPRACTWLTRRRRAGSAVAVRVPGQVGSGAGVGREGGREASLVEQAPSRGVGGSGLGRPARQAGCDRVSL